MVALRALLSVAALAVLFRLATSTSFNVGGPTGAWDLNTKLQGWASGKTFSVGDSIVFTYSAMHSVLEVSKADYNACQTSSPMESFFGTGGSTTIALTSPRKRYFICGTPGHCSSGMKMEINTVDAAVAGPPLATPSSPPPNSSPKAKPPSPHTKAPPPEHHVHHSKPPNGAPTSAPSKPPSSSVTPASASPPQTSAANDAVRKALGGLVSGMAMLMIFVF